MKEIYKIKETTIGGTKYRVNGTSFYKENKEGIWLKVSTGEWFESIINERNKFKNI